VALIRSGRMASLETALGVAEEAQSGEQLYDDPSAVTMELQKLAAVTPADVQRVAAMYLAPERQHIFRVDQGPPQPFEEPVPYVGATGTPQDDAWTVNYALPYPDPPAPLPVTSLDFPPMSVETLPNGLEVVVVETPELPVLSLDLVLKGGQSVVPAGEPPAVADITAQLMTRGTTTRDAQEIADTIESRGGVTGAYSGDDLIGFGIFSLIENRELAFDLLEDMAENPTFPDDELQVQVGQLQGGLEAGLSDPGAQVGRAFYPAVYGDHPYGAITTLDEVPNISRDQIQAFYDLVAHPQNALLIIAGRITADEGMALARSHFADWPSSGAPLAINLPAAAPSTPDTTVLVNVPGAQQAELMMGNIAVTGDNPDRYALSVVNAVLGQGLSSRLNQLLREQKGYSYGVSSGISFPADVGTFVVSASVQTSAASDAIASIESEVARIRTEAIGEDELARVRDGMVGRFALNLETYQDYVNTISSYWVRGLPLTDIEDYPERIGAVTPESGLAAAERYLPQNLVTVVSGDASVLQPELEGSEGKVDVIDPR
jgi:zinc protease